MVTALANDTQMLGQILLGKHPRELCAMRRAQATVLETLPERGQYIVPLGSQYRLKPLVRINVESIAACMIGTPLGRADMIEACGRVVLINVEPLKVTRIVPKDPPIPVCLLATNGTYNRVVGRYLEHILSLESKKRLEFVGRRFDIRAWHRQAQRLCDLAVVALTKRPPAGLLGPELEYIVTRLQFLMAWPQNYVYNEDIPDEIRV